MKNNIKLLIYILLISCLFLYGCGSSHTQTEKYITSQHQLLKNLTDISLLVDSKIIESTYDEETYNLFIEYENGTTFELFANTVPFQSGSVIIYPINMIDEKEYITMMTKDYFEDSLIDKIREEGSYTYKDTNGQDITINYSITETTETIELIFE